MKFIVRCFFAVLALNFGNFAAVFAQLAKDDVIQTSTTTTRTTVVPEKTWPAGERPSEIMCSRYARQIQSDNHRLLNDTICASKLEQSISGGRAKAAPKEFPHMAAIGYDSSEGIVWRCVGSLISENFVLAPAHCLKNRDDPPKRVRVGDQNLRDTTTEDARPQVRGVAEIIRYPKYRLPLKYHNIGLLKLDSPVTFDAYVKPACLSLVPRFPDGYNAVEVTWVLDYEDSNYEMWKIAVSTLSLDQCNSFYYGFANQLPNGIDDNSQICSLHSNNKSCLEDIGGPLIANNTKEECMYDVIGIASFSVECSKPVYTKVSYYVSWIESIVWPNLS